MAGERDHEHTLGMTRAVRPSRLMGTPRETALFLWVCMSAGVHVAAFLGWGIWVTANGGGGWLSGKGERDGDGLGGTSIEMEIAGPEDGPPRGATAGGGEQAPPEPPAPPPQEQNQETFALDGELDVRGAEQREERRPEKARRPPRESRPEGDPTQQHAAAAPGGAESPSGTNATDSSAGVPSGSVNGVDISPGAAARSAQVCEDPVVGTWRTQKFRSRDRTWVRFILHVRREGERLTGTIESRIWSGRASDPTPGNCTAFGFDHTWRMQAHGHVDGARMSFGSRTATLVRQDCPSSDARYAPDNFEGTIHQDRELFESLNNDGAFDVDEPYTFRRVSCE